ncbi:hypothetical protein [Aureimonas leprariae]|uniref:hypothetical protein n=1 Tax=Plantimonas leprariae TaxID=2615207 RepID=UPI0013873C8E|nr:hypothetical protein [Aureimonas leprariae]
MNDHEPDGRGTSMLAACFDRTAAQAAALALAGSGERSATARRRPVGWLRSCLRRLVS